MLRATLGPQSVLAGRNLQNTLSAGRPEAAQLVQRCMLWVHRCVSLNATAAASVPLRLFTKRGNTAIAKFFTRVAPELGMRVIDRKTRAWLRSEWISPHTKDLLGDRMDDVAEVQRHAILDLLQDVNPNSDGYAWREGIYTDLQLFGRHFTHLVDVDRGGIPAELWRLMPQGVEVIPSASEFVDSFEYGSGATKTVFPPDEVLWIRMNDPLDPWGGLGPLEAWLRTADASINIQVFQDELFKRHGSPDWMLWPEVSMGPEQKREFRSAWTRMFGTLFRRMHSVAIADGKGKLERLGDSPRDLQFGESEDRKRDQIGQAFGVPKSLLTTDDVNRANAVESMKVHAKFGYWPLVKRVEDALNEQLAQRWGEGFILVHDNPIPEDMEDRREERASRLASGYTINDIRAIDGEPPLEGEFSDLGDVPMATATLKPLERIVAPPEPPPMMPGNNGNNGDEAPPRLEDQSENQEEERAAVLAVKILAEIMRHRPQVVVPSVVPVERAAERYRPNPALPGPPDARWVHAAYEQWARPAPSFLPPPLLQSAHWSKAILPGEPENAEGDDRIPKGMVEGLSDVLLKLRNRVLRALEGEEGTPEPKAVRPTGPTSPEDYLPEGDLEDWQLLLQTEIGKHLKTATKAAGESAVAQVIEHISFDLENPRVQDYLGNSSRRIGRELTDTYRSFIRGALQEGIDEGESALEIAERIRRRVPVDTTRGWARRIARTEMAFAHVKATELGWQQSGVVVGKQFVLAPDACPWCEAVAADFGDGRGEMGESKTVDLGGSFYEVGHQLRAEFENAEGEMVERVMVLDYSPDDAGLTVPPVHPHCRCSVRPVLEGEA
jgi:HK97 family phage portal protein